MLRQFAVSVLLAGLVGIASAQPPAEGSSLSGALRSVLALFQDLKRAWDENVTFPASKEQLLSKLDVLRGSLQKLRPAVVQVTREAGRLAPTAPSPQERQELDNRIRALIGEVLALRDELDDLRRLLPPELADRGAQAVRGLEHGLNARGELLERMSERLTGQRDFDPALLEQESERVVAILDQLVDAVDRFRTELRKSAAVACQIVSCPAFF
jgi:hypothetical protein